MAGDRIERTDTARQASAKGSLPDRGAARLGATKRKG
jgi:hypothetical protein